MVNRVFYIDTNVKSNSKNVIILNIHTCYVREKHETRIRPRRAINKKNTIISYSISTEIKSHKKTTHIKYLQI